LTPGNVRVADTNSPPSREIEEAVMTPRERSAFCVRRRLATFCVPLAAALLFGAGCRCHRQAYRPVYPAPAVIEAPLPAAPCPTGDCGGAVASPPAFPDSAAVTPPPIGPLGSEPAAPAGVGAGGGGVTPGTGEPGFDDYPPAGAANGGTNPNGGSGDGLGRSGPNLEAPRAGLRPSTRAARRAVGGGRRAQLRRDLEARTNAPDDLFSPPRADRPWRYVVLHHSAHAEGGLGAIDREHREGLGTDGCGYHFVIGNGSESGDGVVEVARRWAEQKPGAHCRDSVVPEANEYGIGICLVGDLDSGPPSEAQVASARALVAYLQDRYGIPAENVRVHAGVAKSATSCPGRYFPAQAILAEPDRGFAAR
jgi:hypothetical protein